MCVYIVRVLVHVVINYAHCILSYILRRKVKELVVNYFSVCNQRINHNIQEVLVHLFVLIAVYIKIALVIYIELGTYN